MADKPLANTVKMEDGTIGHLSPNYKLPHLREVEEDAEYITKRRVEEAADEREREEAKRQREAERQAEAEEARNTNGLGGGETYTPDSDKDKKDK
jgi:hypothetical protein